MIIDKLTENWNILKDETRTAILKLVDKEIEKDPFVPEKGDKYYVYLRSYRNGTLDIVSQSRTLYQMYTRYGEYFAKIGKAFRSSDEAIFAGWCEYYTERYETYVNRYSKKLDWENNNQNKYYAYYSFFTEDIKTDYRWSAKSQGTVYASSEQVLKDAIVDIGEENFLKYIMKVGNKAKG